MKNNFKYFLPFLLFFLIGCAGPGISSPGKMTFSGERYVELDDGILLQVEDINYSNFNSFSNNYINEPYRIAPGDVLTIIIWGLSEIFPNNFQQSASPQNSRTVDSLGNIYFPFVGSLNVQGKTVSEVRKLITLGLSENFVNPQVDVTVTKYNQKQDIYVIGEVNKPQKLTIGIDGLSLADAIGSSLGLNLITANAKEVYVIRGYEDMNRIYRIDLSTSDKMIIANKFQLMPEDVVFIGTSSITKWNRMVSQFFPFASFLNQVDAISNRD
jgi:protein involved in polysaccharide export with SLBB domain